MSSQTYRPKFFEGQYLGAADLSAIVEHDRISDARHMLGAHTWGIAIGLNVKPVTQPDGSLQMAVQPGYAWDGFGRPIVVLAPASISPALFRNIGYNAAIDEPAGRLVPVWIRYREAATREPASGFQLTAIGRLPCSHRSRRLGGLAGAGSLPSIRRNTWDRC